MTSPPTQRKVLSWLCDQRRDKTGLAIAKYICVDGAPFSVVENQGFQEMMKDLIPGIELPSRATLVRKYIPELVATTKSRLQRMLAECDDVAIAVDSWTSTAHRTYLGVVCHYIAGWKIHSAMLGIKRLFVDRDADCHRQIIEAVLKEWHLEGKVCAAVSDNEAVICKSISDWLESPLASEDGFQVHCGVHTLQLAVRQAFRDCRLDEFVQRWRSVVVHINRSSKLGDILEREAIEAELHKRRLVEDVETRWNSMLDMMQRLVDLQKPLIVVMSSKAWGNVAAHERAMKESDFDELKEIIGILKPLKSATDLLCGERYVSLSTLYPVFLALVRYHLIPSPQDSALARELKHTLVENLRRQWSEKLNDTVPLLATLLDPRMRRHHLLSTEEGRELERRFRMAAKRQVRILQARLPRTLELEESGSGGKDTAEPGREIATAAAVADALEAFVGCSTACSHADRHSRATAPSDVDEAVDLECSAFFKEDCIPMRVDPLQWWSDMCRKLPLLAALSKRYLACPATSASCERLFSDASYIVDDLSSSLTDEHIEMKLFVYHNSHVAFER
jgi:hypothetical protein